MIPKVQRKKETDGLSIITILPQCQDKTFIEEMLMVLNMQDILPEILM
jgi:hypothetical protein